MSDPLRILVAEDDEQMLDLLERVLADEGYEVIGVRDGAQALDRIEQSHPDLVLTDIRIPNVDGMGVLRRAMARELHQPVILMTAFGSIESAVQAIREGAYHYLAKPFDIEDLLEVVATAAEHVRRSKATQSVVLPGGGLPFPLVFRSAAMMGVVNLAQDVATSTATVLVTGGSGTGKELLARAIHAMSPRRERAFVPVDCTAIPESLIESALFGHRRGAYTGANEDRRGLLDESDKGTLFLDEVSNLSLMVQAKLLRFLQERRFRRVGDVEERGLDTRVIAATNRDLYALVQSGAFREDLYYRLSVIPLRVPDLKDRREDITPLAYHFIRKLNREYQVQGIRQDALDLLLDHGWPGNIRELENVIERAVILRKAGLIQPRDLPEIIARRDAGAHGAGKSLEEMERDYILHLLEDCGGNQSRVARILGINRRTLYRKLKKYGAAVTGNGDDL